MSAKASAAMGTFFTGTVIVIGGILAKSAPAAAVGLIVMAGSVLFLWVKCRPQA